MRYRHAYDRPCFAVTRVAHAGGETTARRVGCYRLREHAEAAAERLADRARRRVQRGTLDYIVELVRATDRTPAFTRWG